MIAYRVLSSLRRSWFSKHKLFVVLWFPKYQCNAFNWNLNGIHNMLIIIVQHDITSSPYNVIHRMCCSATACFRCAFEPNAALSIRMSYKGKQYEMQWICFLFRGVQFPSQQDACSNWLRQPSIGHLLGAVSSKALLTCQTSQLLLLLNLCYVRASSGRRILCSAAEVDDDVGDVVGC